VAESIDIEQLCERAWEYLQEDPLFPLQGESWHTGLSGDGRQMLVAMNDRDANILWFDSDGRLISAEVVSHTVAAPHQASRDTGEVPHVASFLRERFGYRESAIQVRCFQDQKSGIAVKLLPYWLEEFATFPERKQEEWRKVFAEDLDHWIKARDTYVLEAWRNTFFIDARDGHCTAS
jgi:hypothetical protein